jgi:hypothetical protein
MFMVVYMLICRSEGVKKALAVAFGGGIELKSLPQVNPPPIEYW